MMVVGVVEGCCVGGRERVEEVGERVVGVRRGARELLLLLLSAFNGDEADGNCCC